MKSIAGLILMFSISCQGKQEPETVASNLNSAQLDKLIKNQDSLFILDYNVNENFVRIIAPETSDFKFPDTSYTPEPFKIGDFNADSKEDIMVNLGGCGTGGCVYGLFLNQYGNYYKLAFINYLKNVEFRTDKNGLWIIESSEELEPYNPSKIQVSIFKFNKNKYHYLLDTTFVYHDKEAEVMITKMKLMDSLKFISLMPHCLEQEQPDANSIFWSIVKLKLEVIDELIEKIDDTTKTTAIVRWFGGYWTVGDISYKAMEEIIHEIPTFELLGIQYDEKVGYSPYWFHLRSNTNNRKQFKQNLKNWYKKNKSNLVWVTRKWDGSECFYHNPNNGYYEIKK
ncbi:MAG: hypothetical protein KF900_06655 [Bacteroidetes bacterium]|nr:hypothetical protein [Bacteroidota bacterium]